MNRFFILIRCDRCKRIYTFNKNRHFNDKGIDGFDLNLRKPDDEGIWHYCIDLCDECCDDLMHFIEGWPVVEPHVDRLSDGSLRIYKNAIMTRKPDNIE